MELPAWSVSRVVTNTSSAARVLLCRRIWATDCRNIFFWFCIWCFPFQFIGWRWWLHLYGSLFLGLSTISQLTCLNNMTVECFCFISIYVMSCSCYYLKICISTVKRLHVTGNLNKSIKPNHLPEWIFK